MGREMISAADFRKGLADEAVNESAREKAGGDITWLSTKDGKFALGDTKLPDEFDVVVLGYTFENAYYDPSIKWDPNNPSPPLCFAVDEDEDEMVPHKDSPEPQSESCLGCEFNEFGSGDGNGKACKNRRRLALMDPEEGDIMLVRIPPTGIKNWRLHLKRLNNEFGVPPYGAVSTIFFDQDNGKVLDYDVVDAELEDDELVNRIIANQSEASELLMTPINCEVREVKKVTKKTSKKKSSSKKTSGKTSAKTSGKKRPVRRRV